MFPQTSSEEFELVLFRGRCSATCPLSLVTLSMPAIVTPPFLAENQMVT
jgi:hypothetical protein